MSITAIPEPATTIEVPAVTDAEGERREVLLRAAEIIEQRGWTHGADGMLVAGPFCLLGAVAHAMKGSHYIDEDQMHCYSMHGPAQLIGVSHETAYRWNDSLPYVESSDGFLKLRKTNHSKYVTDALRSLANGSTWEEATRLP